MKITSFAGLLSALLLFAVYTESTASAQAPNLFGGKGIRTTPFGPKEEKPARQWPRLLDFSADKPAAKERQSMFGGPLQKSTWKQEVAPEPTVERPRLFGGMPSLFAKPDPTEPNLIQRMNERSKDFVDRTADWAHEKNQNFRERSFDTWDAMTKNLRPAQPAIEGTQPANPLGTQPSVRTAENAEARPSVKF